MKSRKIMIAAILCAAGVCGTSWAQGNKKTSPAPQPAPTPSAPPAAAAPTAHVPMNAADLKWGDAPPGLPPGSKMAVLSGNPEAPGLFTVRAKFPAGYTIMPHSHPTDEQVTVLQGTISMGMGDTLDKKSLQQLRAGGFVSIPKQGQHYVVAKTACVIQITAMGPFAIMYVNPDDDPRNAPKPQ